MIRPLAKFMPNVVVSQKLYKLLYRLMQFFVLFLYTYLDNQLTSRHVSGIDGGRLHGETRRIKFSDLLSRLKYLYRAVRGQRILLWERKVRTIVESS